VEDSLELLMRGEVEAIVEDSFDKIQEQEQDDNEETFYERVRKKYEFVAEKDNN